jgi:flagellar hook-associated protein 2
MSTSSTTPTSSVIFNGSSRYSSDFQAIITRSVAIASMPISQLNTQHDALTAEQKDMQTLDTKFTALQTAIGTLNDAIVSGSLGATLSDDSTLTASVGTGALEGNYSVEVTDLGAYTTTLSATPGPCKVTTPSTQSLSSLATPAFVLKVGTTNYTITPATNTLNGLADAINATTAANVQASVVNAGTAGAPDYRLSLQSTQLGNFGIQLTDGSISLAAEQVRGNATDTYTATQSPAPGPNLVADPDKQNITHLAKPTFSLTVGSNSYTLAPVSNTLTSLVDSINANTDAGVHATLVDVGSTSSPDYRLSLQSATLGDVAIQLNDGSADLQNEQVRGSLATYKVNGVAEEAESNSRTVTIAPGLTVNLLHQSQTAGQATNITLTRQSTPISDALQAFSTAYNAAVDELDKQRGTANGSLAGNSIVNDLSGALESMTNNTLSGTGVNSLAAIGLQLDQTGHMSFTPLDFLSADFSDSAGVTKFLGAADTGGFLKTATDAINQIEDPIHGSLKTSLTSVQTEITSTTDQISTEQSRVDALQASLQEQMASADAAIAMMEQQYDYMSQMFQAQQTADQMYK